MRKFDLFPKISDESFDVRTSMGGIISLITFFFMIMIIIGESGSLTEVTYKQQAFIDHSAKPDSTDIQAFFNMTIAYPCQLLQIFVKDISGSQLLDVNRDIVRQRLDAQGNPIGKEERDNDPEAAINKCGNCYGSNYTKCCPTCFDVTNSFILQGKPVPNLNNIEQCTRDRKNIEAGEMCLVSGMINTIYTHGEIVFYPGGAVRPPTHFKNDLSYFGESVNLSHWIHTVRFGSPAESIPNPLDGYDNRQAKRGFFIKRYTANLVRTIAEERGNQFRTVQYSAYFSEREINKPVSKKHPGIIISFNTAPILVRVYKSSKTLSQFLTNICAIIGGGFTIGGLADSFLFKFSIKKD